MRFVTDDMGNINAVADRSTDKRRRKAYGWEMEGKAYLSVFNPAEGIDPPRNEYGSRSQAEEVAVSRNLEVEWT